MVQIQFETSIKLWSKLLYDVLAVVSGVMSNAVFLSHPPGSRQFPEQYSMCLLCRCRACFEL